MNCKQGDLAMVVGGLKGTQIGKTCTCIRLMSQEEHGRDDGPYWATDRLFSYMVLSTGWRNWHSYCPDRMLRPIGDGRIEVRELESVADGCGDASARD